MRHMCGQGALTDQEFWQDPHLQTRLRVDQVETGVGAQPTCVDLSGAADDDSAIDNEVTEYICASDPAVLHAYRQQVP
jgi:hypothetical protein